MLHLLKACELRALRGHLDRATHEHGTVGSHDVRIWIACRDAA